MKSVSLYLLYILLPFSMFANDKALIIGIGNYPQNSGWKKISSANDVELLCKSLPSNFAITTLVDNLATYERIKSSLNELSTNSVIGDTLFLHFSCHGQQVICNDKDEADYLDEALVPYDAFSKRTENYQGECHFLDDEFGQFLIQLRTAIGSKGLLIVTLDACFSDSMDKGEQDKNDGSVIYRGGESIFGSNSVSVDSLNFIESHHRETDKYELSKSKTLSDIVIISACKSFQKNMEVNIDGKGYGSLSYSIFQSLKATDFNNIKSWIDTVLDRMSDNAFTQNPQVRTTLDYKSRCSLNKTTATSEQSFKSRGKHYIYLLSGGVVCVLIIIIAWMKRKK